MPIIGALGAIKLKKFIITFIVITITFVGYIAYRIHEASAPLKAVYGSHLSVKLSSTRISNFLNEPIVICGSLYDKSGLEREYILWGDGKERWVHLEGKSAMFTSIKGTMCK